MFKADIFISRKSGHFHFLFTCIKKYLTKTQKYANIKRYKIYCPLSVQNGIYAPNTRETGVFYSQEVQLT